MSGRPRRWSAALHALRKDPKNLAGFVFQLSGLNGYDFGQYLLRRLPREALRAGAVEIMSRDGVVLDFQRDGLRWQVDTGDDVGRHLYASGNYEGEEIEAVLRWLDGKTGTVVDLGANVGTTTIPFALAGYHVIAVEPVPATFDMLTTNVSRNNLTDRVECVRKAIALNDGTVDMWTGFGSGQAEVAVEGVAPRCERFGDRGDLVTVPSGPLGSIVEDPTGIVLIWADVQGSEMAVIETGGFLWDAGVPLYVEIDPPRLDLYGGTSKFTQIAEKRFRSFLSDEDLMNGRDEQPIKRLKDFVDTIIATRKYSDALLIPPSHTR